MRGCKSLGKPLPTDAERLFPFRAKDDGQMCLKQGKKVVSNADTRTEHESAVLSSISIKQSPSTFVLIYSPSLLAVCAENN